MTGNMFSIRERYYLNLTNKLRFWMCVIYRNDTSCGNAHSERSKGKMFDMVRLTKKRRQLGHHSKQTVYTVVFTDITAHGDVAAACGLSARYCLNSSLCANLGSESMPIRLNTSTWARWNRPGGHFSKSFNVSSYKLAEMLTCSTKSGFNCRAHRHSSNVLNHMRHHHKR